MVFNRFGWVTAFLAVLLALAGLALMWVFLQEQYLFITRVSLAALWIGLLLGLIYYVQRTNRDLERFLQNLRHLDRMGESREQDASFRRLNITYNRIIKAFKEVRSDEEAGRQFFRYTMEQLPVGLIVFTGDGEVEYMNPLARDILQVQKPGNYAGLSLNGNEAGEVLFHLPPGRRELLKLQVGSMIHQLSVHASVFTIQGKRLRLISLQNIQGEMEKSELEAWEKLIRVMTHEIMNSVSPIKSLTYSMQMMLKEELKQEQEDSRQEILHKTQSGLEAIEKRSKGLLDFVQSYKQLTSTSYPDFREVRVKDLFDEVRMLMADVLEGAQVVMDVEMKDNGITIMADEKLISQVLINLVQNALYVLSGQKNARIGLQAHRNKDGDAVLEVTDNGPGIPKEEMDKIFIPFYSTREGGTGIGLAFARQVMHMHRARLMVQSEEGGGTRFLLVF